MKEEINESLKPQLRLTLPFSGNTLGQPCVEWV